MAIYLVTEQIEIISHDIYKICDWNFFEDSLNSILDDVVGVDTETHGLDPHTKDIICLQIGDYKTQFVIDWKFIDQNKLIFLQQYFKREDLTFLFQNAKFDLRFLYHHNIIPVNIYDTYLAERILTKGLLWERKSLDYLCKKYLNIHMDKTVRGMIYREGLSAKVIKYAADDVKYLKEIKDKQFAELEKWNLLKDLNLENKYVKCLAYIEYCGFKLDKDKWLAKIKQDKINLSDAENILDNFIIDNRIDFEKFIDNQLDLFSTETKIRINWASPKQVLPIFHKLDINTKTKDKKTKEIKDSLEATVLEAEINKHPIVKLYLNYKAKDKVVSTYGENFIESISPATNRIHTNFSQIMDSGRTSSGGQDKQNNIDYINFQNIPADPETRGCFVAEEGNSLIISDYSGQETIVLANESLEPKLLQFYTSGESDLHSFVAKQIYPECKDLSLKEIKKQYPELRQIAKVANFAIVYGATPITIAAQCKITLEQAEFVYNTYFESFPGLRNYFKKCHEATLKNGYITIDELTGSKCFIPYYEEFKELKKEFTNEFWNEYKIEKAKDTLKFNSVLKPKVRKYFSKKSELDRQSVNYSVQGISSRISKLAGIMLFDKIVETNNFMTVKIVNFIHDEYVIETPDNITTEWKDILQKSMEDAGSYWCKTIKLTAEPLITKIWIK